MLFTKLIRILIGFLVVWLFFHLLLQLGRKKTMTHTKKQGDDNRGRRKFVESHVVENSNQAEDETQS